MMDERITAPIETVRADPAPRPPKPLQVHETGVLVLPPSMTVGELAELVKLMETKFGVSAAMAAPGVVAIWTIADIAELPPIDPGE